MKVNHGDVPEGAVFAGVDTHADAHWLCVLDAIGRPLLSERVPATPDGYDALAAAVRGAGEPAAVRGVIPAPASDVRTEGFYRLEAPVRFEIRVPRGDPRGRGRVRAAADGLAFNI